MPADARSEIETRPMRSDSVEVMGALDRSGAAVERLQHPEDLAVRMRRRAAQALVPCLGNERAQRGGVERGISGRDRVEAVGVVDEARAPALQRVLARGVGVKTPRPVLEALF